MVRRQLGPIQAPLTREPDIVIRFVDQLSTASCVRYIGLDDATSPTTLFWCCAASTKPAPGCKSPSIKSESSAKSPVNAVCPPSRWA